MALLGSRKCIVDLLLFVMKACVHLSFSSSSTNSKSLASPQSLVSCSMQCGMLASRVLPNTTPRFALPATIGVLLCMFRPFDSWICT